MSSLKDQLNASWCYTLPDIVGPCPIHCSYVNGFGKHALFFKPVDMIDEQELKKLWCDICPSFSLINQQSLVCESSKVDHALCQSKQSQREGIVLGDTKKR